MANKKISELPYINNNQISGNTLIPLVTYYSATTGDTVHTFVQDFENFLSESFLNLSGNTTASCINDIYVTNLHGCSPITIHDSLQSTGSTSTGTLSFSFGDLNVASGDYSHAIGYRTSATTVYSHSEGSVTLASGDASHSEGIQTTASGNASHSEGNQTTASGVASHSEGQDTNAIGDYSHSEGQNSNAVAPTTHAEGLLTISGFKSFTASTVSSGVATIPTAVDLSTEFTSGQILINNGSVNDLVAYSSTTYTPPNFIINLTTPLSVLGTPINVVDVSNLISNLATDYYGQGSHSEGLNTTSVGNGSHAEGRASFAYGDYSHTEGHNTIAGGTASHAEGYTTSAMASYSHAEGDNTLSNGSASHAEGSYTVSSGYACHAEGDFTQALTYASHSEGYGTIATGTTSHAQGYETIALGDYSHSGGYQTKASGDTSFVHSKNSFANGDRSVVIGGQNITGNTADTVYVPKFVIYTEYEPTSSADTAGEPGSITWSSNTDALYYKTANGWFILTGTTF